MSHAPRKITPGINTFLDVKAYGDQIRVLSLRDEEVHVDIMEMKTHELKNYTYSNTANFSYEWPFLAYV